MNSRYIQIQQVAWKQKVNAIYRQNHEAGDPVSRPLKSGLI